MPRVGAADLPLHGGSAPRWLFVRMVDLASAISDVMILEYGTQGYIRRLSDPFWFQAFSCVLGFDWHSSGATTVTCGALKEALKDSTDIAVVGGKGKASRTTIRGIETWSDSKGISVDLEKRMIRSSKMSAKVDSAAVQDGHQLYHHSFIFDERGNWATIQQGMSDITGYARRYHWYSGDLKDFVEEPHSAILGSREENILDMTSRISRDSRSISVDLINDGPEHMESDVVSIENGQTTLYQWSGQKEIRLTMPRGINWSAMRKAYEFSPTNYEELLEVPGVGPSTVRALALIGELIYGKEPSWKDPVKYSFAVGGKDGVPFPVDRKAMDESTRILREGIEAARIEEKDRLRAIRRLNRFIPEDV
jgi:hypothetical protein